MGTWIVVDWHVRVHLSTQLTLHCYMPPTANLRAFDVGLPQLLVHVAFAYYDWHSLSQQSCVSVFYELARLVIFHEVLTLRRLLALTNVELRPFNSLTVFEMRYCVWILFDFCERFFCFQAVHGFR